ncbi:hypothetical protein K461DRAFT_294207 [Myriangium duriaei CBS 260.36]|uniref:Uncharacterized protein n=1 Tax=Myriangium duriaei CBS 260.36 TaxID=1168546 RepID=A0A9P4J324_9PEZI|nr:hypothetical protein K461DRAFT_294207 [Myriangium duriaei CBS 260.36]
MASQQTWSTSTPIVLDKASLTELLELILNNHGPSSRIVICSTKEVFLSELYSAIIQDSIEQQQRADAGTSNNPINLATQNNPDSPPSSIIQQHHLLTPTLNLLSSSRTLKTAFCPDVPHTLAHLTHLSLQGPAQDTPGNTTLPILTIVNPISQHRGTISFSAQGLARFFSAAVHTAHVLGAKLVIVECGAPVSEPQQGRDGDEDLFMPPPVENVPESVWDEEVSMLNVTTKTFGAGQRGWQGRTVQLRRIAERWCEFVVAPES